MARKEENRMDTENERITVTFYTGKENCLQLSSAALNAMGNPTYAQVLINPKTHQMLLMGTNEKRPNCILLQHRWAKHKNGKIPCNGFIERLSSIMGWNPGCRYMVFGNLTQTKPVSSQPVLGFNLDECYISENKRWKGADQCERKRILPTDHTERLGLGIRAEELLQG
jgi:hypothetical protein